jgi:hypothetical protein
MFFFVDDLKVGYCGMQYRIPVDQPFATVDQVFLVQRDVDFQYRRGETFVHGKAFT